MLPTFQSHLEGGQPSPRSGLHHLHEAFRKAHLVIAAEVAAEEGHRGARLPSASRAANAVHVVLDGVGHVVVHHLEKCGTSGAKAKKHHPSRRWPICFVKKGGKKTICPRVNPDWGWCMVGFTAQNTPYSENQIGEE